MLGVRRAGVSDGLAEIRNSGIVEHRRKAIKIIDAPRLLAAHRDRSQNRARGVARIVTAIDPADEFPNAECPTTLPPSASNKAGLRIIVE
jgi:hypothetical protein